MFFYKYLNTMKYKIYLFLDTKNINEINDPISSYFQ